MKLYISPNPLKTEDLRGVGGIWSVVHAQGRWLPEYGVELVNTPEEADVVNIHAGEVIDTSKPLVTSNHGLYWTADLAWRDEYWQYNNPVIEALRRAHAIIVPSQWVAMPIKRDLRKVPYVIPHGISGGDFEPQVENQGYVLWAKPRVDVVSDPRPMNLLAERVRDVKFLSTYGRPAENVEILGVLPYEDFQGVLSRAALWLATTRETGDIASREAMAFGIPVLGWDWGATAELVKHKETGYLARLGDYGDLEAGLRYCLEHRERLGTAARTDVLARFQWRDIMGQYAAVYQSVLEADDYPVDVSIIVPTFNYAHFLPECLDSINNLDFSGTIEVIVVDDASTDNTQSVLANYDGLRVIQNSVNEGLPAVLNRGHKAAQGKYIMNLDADNTLSGSGLQTLYDALETKPWVDVATGHYQVIGQSWQNGGPVDAWQQMEHQNQIPSTCLIRARSIRHLGGYRVRQVKNEDAELWCRGMAAGLRCENVTDQVIFNYRWHDRNKSKLEGGEDDPEGPQSWNFYCPWRKNHGITPFAMLGNPPKASWAVRSYTRPHVAVVIPCGPGHERLVVDALDSVAGQTYTRTECIVANDTGKELDVAAMGHPWVKVVQCGGGVGPAIARNTAIAASTAPLIVPLDADDMLYPRTVQNYYEAWLEHPESLVYADCETEDGLGERRNYYYSGPWSWQKVSQEAIYQDCIMFAKQWWEAVGGYPVDQSEGVWEDWLFGVKLHLIGVGATYIQAPWGVYRRWTAGACGRSKNDLDSADYGKPEFKARHRRLLEWIQEKERTMPCAGCRKSRRGRTRTPQGTRIQAGGEDFVAVYEGDRQGGWHVNSRVERGKKYRIEPRVPFIVRGGDIHVVSLPGFRRVEQAEEGAAIPEEMPAPPVKQPDAPQPPPVVVEQAPEPPPVLEPPSGPGDDGLGALATIPRVDLTVLREYGYDNIGKVIADLRHERGRGLLEVPGIGIATLAKIRKAVEHVHA